MPLIQEAKITFQQFEKWIISFCLTSIFKMELKWEIPIFHDFTSHTLCKYGHHQGLHLSRLKTSWRERCPACTIWMWAQLEIQEAVFIKTIVVPWYMNMLALNISIYLAQLLNAEKRGLSPFSSNGSPDSSKSTFPASARSTSTSPMLGQTSDIPWGYCYTCPPPAQVLCSNSHSIPQGWQWPFFSIALIRLFHSDYRLRFKNSAC